MTFETPYEILWRGGRHTYVTPAVGRAFDTAIPLQFLFLLVIFLGAWVADRRKKRAAEKEGTPAQRAGRTEPRASEAVGRCSALHHEVAARGEIVAVQKPEVHEGIIRLARRSEFAPFVGRACYSGYVHDLFGWRDNTPSMYAEPLEKPWHEVVTMIGSGGAGLFAAFSKRLGVR